MANGDPIQGLRVAFKFADSQDTKEILRNLNLNIDDLDRIRNIVSDGGVQKTDIRTLSGLSIDLEKEAIAVYNETQSYQSILTSLNDGSRNIAGNLNVSSGLVSPSFKFNTINYASVPLSIETVDFSTSRSSAWSSFGNSEASIFYGGDVVLSGNTSSIELSSLEFMETPKLKRFESEIATHKIRVNIDNEPYDLYAMKSIPIQFKAFFRSATNMRVDFNILNNLRPTWVIKNPKINGVQPEFVYQNRTTATGEERTSQISFFDSRSVERTIEFYYPVDRIVRIYLNATRLTQIPNAVLPNLIDFRATDGDLIEMPNIATIYPSIDILDLSRNDLTRSSNPQLRTFSPQVIQRLKTENNTLRELILDGTYSNECTADLGQLDNATGTVGLTSFKCDSQATNSRRMNGTSPGVGTKILNYNIIGNNFTALHPSVLQSTSLQLLNIRSNNISAAIDTSGTNLQSIKTFITGGNSHPIVDLSGKLDLTTYQSDNQNFTVNSVGTMVFNNCLRLSTIRINNSNVTGVLPNFSSNESLEYFYSWGTRWSDASASYSIDSNTFGPTSGGCRAKLIEFNLQSGNLRGPIHPDAFRNMTALAILAVRSYRSGITGVYPESINQCFNLRGLYLDQNFIGGEIPNFSGNKIINTIVLSLNSFTGVVPVINLPRLSIFFVNNNSLTGFLGMACPNLTQLNASVNLLGEIPRLSGIPKLQILLLNNNPGMKYISGELTAVTGIRRIEMANCGFDRGTIDQILIDLNDNYNINQRRGVFVNLVGNESPSATTEITTIINRLRREGWTLGLQP